MKIANFDTSKEVFIIAELSANHAGSLELALQSIKAAKKAGANAIKIQTYTPDSLTLNSDKDDFIIKGGLWDKRKLYELYESAKTPYEWHSLIFEAAQNEGIICFSSPFCKDDIDFLSRFDPPAYKIASFEANDEHFVRQIAKQKKPSIVSTGIASEAELERVVQIFKEEQNENLIFLKCTSAYPASLEDMNLRAILSLKAKFGIEVGLSDHSFGNLAAILAVGLGARVIEKHFMLDKSIKSEDSAFSLDFDEFKALVKAVREAESALGDGHLNLDEKALKNRTFARSLYASKDIKKGELFSSENVRSVRPSFGLHPSFYPIILGKKATKDIEFGTALKESDFE
ncbi:pseudaminic acid synthase [Campylobacter sp. MIT 99-7217]|uniref:pseudaminic acid synthase n=1 Tax=Campylobacter sp. MIT 99-7217 TaxID=535091 RepID=UPI0011599426|nr:pseudaminic acid synthase [Campylobacter sp. MIT 99-7217]TQR33824.1 pseudaminic acid synthase [Campylobacter sp. MIT 99-7217]